MSYNFQLELQHFTHSHVETNLKVWVRSLGQLSLFLRLHDLGRKLHQKCNLRGSERAKLKTNKLKVKNGADLRKYMYTVKVSFLSCNKYQY